MSFGQIKLAAQECFGVSLPVSRAHGFKEQLAIRYRPSVDHLLEKMLCGPVLHVDETKIRLKDETGYVFVLTSIDAVVYVYRPTRETQFLLEMLKDFRGVLVSDFFTGYDSATCQQQKCLVHLIRDFNEDLLRNPRDEELKAIASGFGRVLRKIVAAIDRHGLRTRYLQRYARDVDRWYVEIGRQIPESDIAGGYLRRLEKYRSRLFAFLSNDGVPWNNNNAEHAIKPLAKYRRLITGRIKKRGLEHYLTLLSVQQTCHYRNIHFLEFLRSEMPRVDAYSGVNKSFIRNG